MKRVGVPATGVTRTEQNEFPIVFENAELSSDSLCLQLLQYFEDATGRNEI